MATKTFKIGEYCKGGVITVEITKKTITVIGKDWDTSTGYGKSSNQSNAKEFTRETVAIGDPQLQRTLTQFLNELTTHYYSEQVMDWIREKAKLPKSLFW